VKSASGGVLCVCSKAFELRCQLWECEKSWPKGVGQCAVRVVFSSNGSA
jgi:hypothetical protein